MSASARLEECRSILAGNRDRLRVVWDEQATSKDRRLLLAMAGKASSMASRLIGLPWVDLSQETRVAIAGGLRRWREWAERVA